MQFKKSQSSLEFLTIFGIALVLILVLSGIFFSYSSGASESLGEDQIRKIGNTIMNNVAKIYFLGSGNKITVKASFPDGIGNISIIHMNISNSSGDYNQFDILNISYGNNGGGNSLTLNSNIFYTNELYIRFDCNRCTNTTPINGNWISYYNDTSDFSQGAKRISIKSSNNTVYIDFIKE